MVQILSTLCSQHICIAAWFGQQKNMRSSHDGIIIPAYVHMYAKKYVCEGYNRMLIFGYLQSE